MTPAGLLWLNGAVQEAYTHGVFYYDAPTGMVLLGGTNLALYQHPVKLLLAQGSLVDPDVATGLAYRVAQTDSGVYLVMLTDARALDLG